MIHVITGAPCAGKSTYVTEHAKKGDLIVDYDKIALTLGAINSHAAEGLIKKAAFAAREGAIKEALKDPEAESWIIHTTPNEEHMRMYREADAEFIHLDTDKETCLSRAAEDDRPQQTLEAIEKYFGKGVKKMQTKEFDVKYKEEGNGMIEGYASTWVREPDSYGDVVKQGAFKRSLQEWYDSGRKIPFLWSHGMDDLKAFIGAATADEDDYGLHFVAELDDTPEAQRVRELYKDGRLSKFSFAYDVVDQAEVTLTDGRKANELRDLTLYEISAVTVPANDTAEVVAVKAQVAEKAGKRNSKADEDVLRRIRELADSISDLASGLIDLTEGEDEPEANAVAEEQKASNPDKDRLLKYIETMEGLK